MKRSAVRWFAITATVALLVIGAFALRLQWAMRDGLDTSRVVSISRSPEYQAPALLAEARRLPVASIYEHDGVDWQQNVSFCGPTSVVNVLRSLGSKADQSTILEGSGLRTFLGFLPGGMTLDEVGDLLRLRTGRPVRVLRDLDLAAFRAEMARTNDATRRYIVNFHRGMLFGTGGGHFSPIAGYLPQEDLVFVLDVNRKYEPWLVKTERLFAAVDTVDNASGRKRGLVLVE
jgi:hypothetical protein